MECHKLFFWFSSTSFFRSKFLVSKRLTEKMVAAVFFRLPKSFRMIEPKCPELHRSANFLPIGIFQSHQSGQIITTSAEVTRNGGEK